MLPEDAIMRATDTILVLCESCRLIAIQYYMTDMQFTLFESLYYFLPGALLLLCMLVIVLELKPMIENEAFRIMIMWPAHFTLAAVLGLAVNFLSLGVVTVTSSLSYNVRTCDVVFVRSV